LFAVAILAAGLGDSVVESVSNTGIFGQYTDNNHLGVLPTLLAGAIIALEIVALRCADVCRSSARRSRRTLMDTAAAIGCGSARRDIPFIFTIQLAALFTLETAEQVIAGGKLLGGTAWLGGPVIFSLLTHAFIGTVCRQALSACMRAMVRTFATLVDTVVRFIWLAIVRASDAAVRLVRRMTPCTRAQAPRAREIGGRAPPLLQTLIPNH
jgi:hypothetical protein